MLSAPRLNQISRAFALGIALTLSGLAGAQPGAAVSGSQAQKEREACLSGKSGQDQAACLREVGAAQEAARKGNLDSGHGQLEGNRTDRCKALTGADQADCYARMRGEGKVEGSVKGGGIIREKRTVIHGDAAGKGSTSAGTAGAGAGAASSVSSSGAAPATAASGAR